MAKISNKWLFYIFCIFLYGPPPPLIEANLQDHNHIDDDLVWVNKCCEKFEILVDTVCSQVNESGKAKRHINYKKKKKKNNKKK